MQQPFYRRLFPATVIAGKNTENELETAHGGFRLATSVGGTLTGRGGNLIIIDDPQKPDQAMSKVARDNVWNWFTQTLGSRLDNKADDAIVVIMQRLHVDDLTGRLLQNDNWELLEIPAIAHHEQPLVISPGRVLIRRPDDVLDEIREPRWVLDNLRQELGSSTFSAQYQQQPVPLEGGLIKRDWLVYYDRPPANGRDVWIVQSWDTAYKPGEYNDYSVCTTWVVKDQDAFLIDVWRARVDFPNLLKMALELRQRHRADIILVEDAGSGTSLIQAMKDKGIRPKAVKPTTDKITRLSAASALIEGGRVRIPGRAPWLDNFMAELLAFPEGTHDDMVDSLSQFIDWLTNRSRNCVGTRRISFGTSHRPPTGARRLW